MKHLFIIFLMIPVTLFSQNKFDYEFLNRSFSQGSEMRTIYKATLYVDGVESIYKSHFIEDNELAVQVEANDDKEIGFKLTKENVTKTRKEDEFGRAFIKNIKTKTLKYRTQGKTGEYVLIESSLPKLIWDFQKETKEIGGLKCNLAITTFKNRRYFAWYSKEIPISAGPHIFYGLPGLIVNLKSEDNKYEFRLTGISTIKSHPIELPPYEDIITIEEYLKSKTTNLRKYYRAKKSKNPQSIIKMSMDSIFLGTVEVGD